jgi:ABC-type transporter Mla subunit MlaD
MSEKNGSSAAGAKPDADALRAEIKQTRAELGETVQALAAKADVKARAKDQVEQTKQKVKAQATEAVHNARDAAVAATDKVRAAAGQAGDRARTAVDDPKVQDAKAQVRRNQVPIAAVFAGVAALVGIILIVRGRRR